MEMTRSKFQSSLKIFIVKRNKIQLGFDNIYPENNQRVPRQRKTVSKIMLRHFTKKCMESTASKLFIKRCIWLHLWAKVAQFFIVLILRYLELQDILPSRTTTEQTYKFPVCANNWCAFQLRNSATVFQEAHTNSIFSP